MDKFGKETEAFLKELRCHRVMNSRDLAFGSATLAVSAGYYWMATVIPTSQLADAIGPQGLPKTYAILLAMLSLILIGRSVAQRAGIPPTARH